MCGRVCCGIFAKILYDMEFENVFKNFYFIGMKKMIVDNKNLL